MDYVTLQPGIFVANVIKTWNLNFKTYLIARRSDVGCLAHKTRSQHSYPSEYRQISASLNGVTSQTAEYPMQQVQYNSTYPD